MGTYTPRDPGLTGITPSLVAVALTDTFPNTGSVILHVKNGSGSSINVTVTDQTSVAPTGASAFDGDVVVAVAAGAEKYIGPFSPGRFNDASGSVHVAYSAITTVTAEVIDAN